MENIMGKSKLLVCLLIVLTFVLALTACEAKTTYYTVTFDSSGGSTVQNRAIEAGNTIIEPDVPTRTGYNFIGWYNGETKWDFETNIVTSDFKLTAKWEKISHTVTFNSDGGTAVDSQTVYYANLLTQPQAPTRENFRFIGWYSGNAAWDFKSDTVMTDLTLTAKWEAIITYTVSFDSNGGTAVAEQYIEEGMKAYEPPAPTKTKFAFDGWYNGETKWNFDTNTVTETITLKAKWKETYTVTFDSNGGSEVAAIEVPIGEKIPVPDATKENAFARWYVADTDILWNFQTDVVTEPITLKARWEIILPTMPA